MAVSKLQTEALLSSSGGAQNNQLPKLLQLTLCPSINSQQDNNEEGASSFSLSSAQPNKVAHYRDLAYSTPVKGGGGAEYASYVKGSEYADGKKMPSSGLPHHHHEGGVLNGSPTHDGKRMKLPGLMRAVDRQAEKQGLIKEMQGLR